MKNTFHYSFSNPFTYRTPPSHPTHTPMHTPLEALQNTKPSMWISEFGDLQGVLRTIEASTMDDFSKHKAMYLLLFPAVHLRSLDERQAMFDILLAKLRTFGRMADIPRRHPHPTTRMTILEYVLDTLTVPDDQDPDVTVDMLLDAGEDITNHVLRSAIYHVPTLERLLAEVEPSEDEDGDERYYAKYDEHTMASLLVGEQEGTDVLEDAQRFHKQHAVEVLLLFWVPRNPDYCRDMLYQFIKNNDDADFFMNFITTLDTFPGVVTVEVLETTLELIDDDHDMAVTHPHHRHALAELLTAKRMWSSMRESWIHGVLRGITRVSTAAGHADRPRKRHK